MRISRRSCFTLLVISAVGLTAGGASGADALFPRPSHDARAKAEEKVREIYKDELAKAVKPKDKIVLAEVLMTAANGVGQDDASRLVLWTIAIDLAVDANDGHLAMKAVSAIVGRFQPDGPTDPKKQMELGNAPWKEAEAAPADKRLRFQIKAAEWYLRARPVVTGLDEVLIAKRLDEVLTATPPAEPKVNASIPTGWVKISNRKTGLPAGHDAHRPLQIEPAGDFYKIRSQSSGFLALQDWAIKGRARDTAGALATARGAEDRSMFWKFEPVGDGYWRIVNRETGQCLVPRGPKDYHVLQAPPRDGDLEQHWRLEPVKSSE